MEIRYQTASLPCFTLWKNTDTETDGYVTGLEPGSGFPYNRSVEREQGRVPKLDPGAEVGFNMQIDLLENATAVSSVLAEVGRIQAKQEPDVQRSAPC